LSGSSSASPPVEGVEDLVQHIRSGEKPPEAWRVGTEHEKIGLRQRDHRPIPYEGPDGIGALLAGVQEEGGWEPILEQEHVIGLLKDGASITLEPGGQLELSGAPLRTIFETCDEFHTHLDLIRRVSEPLGLVWLSLGANPLQGLDEAPVMPKGRYDIMRAYLPGRGDLALHMMHLTATVQANLDFESEADMATKMRTAMTVTPIVSALFANSPLYQGKPSGYVSRRLHIWSRTDPDRCGMLPFVFDADFSYERYTEWALDVPMFFVVRDGGYLPARGTTFRSFLERGFEGHRPTLEDWDTHLTTLFPEVRLKRFIEVRGADAVPPGLICALPALWKGILYDSEALAEAEALAAHWSFEQRVASLDAVAREGLAAEVGGTPVLGLARELVRIADEGLRRIGHAGGSSPDERGFLDPIRERLERERSPGEEILERWQGEWAGSVDRLIEYARY
jgi:glutamate--cysteine ligase